MYEKIKKIHKIVLITDLNAFFGLNNNPSINKRVYESLGIHHHVSLHKFKLFYTQKFGIKVLSGLDAF